MSVNKAILLGRIGHTPEVKTTDSTTIAKFSLATSEKYNGVDKTEWHNCTAFGKTAELVSKFVSKGALLFVEGRIQYRKYTGKDGTEKSATEIVVSSIAFCDSKKKEEAAAPDYASDAVSEDPDFVPF